MSSTKELLRQAQELSVREADETRPYDYKYQAAQLLKDAIEARTCSSLADFLKAPPDQHGATDPDVFSMCAKRGLVMLETDLLADAQQCVEVALHALQGDEPRHLALLLECHNALGALWSGREDLDQALTCLERAHAMYFRHRTGHGGPVQAAAAAPASAVAASSASDARAAPPSEAVNGHSAAQPSSSEAAEADRPAAAAAVAGEWDDVERHHTTTLFYLAQVHGHAERKVLSAKYCAATLQRQLESGEYKLQEWMQNCMQLSGYYVATKAFAIAQYCLMAAAQVAERANKSLAGAAEQPQSAPELNPELQQLVQQRQQQEREGQPQQNAENGASTTQGQPGQPGQPDQHGLPGQQQRQDGGEGEAPQSQPSKPRQALDPDVAANLELAWAKLYLGRLVASHARFIDGEKDEAPCASVGDFPDILMFKSLDLPLPSDLPWGPAALASTFEQARDLFNPGMTHFKAALEYYVLDGWVTEHCNIQMEVSNMFRCLASFESDLKRRRLMHQQRAQRLQPLHGALNVEFFLGLARSIALELGNISRDVMELEVQEGRPPAKVAVTRQQAVRYYRDFIDTFRNPIGPDGALPDRIADEANERYFLLASFSLGRVLSGKVSDRDVDSMRQSCDLLKWTAAYVQRHDVEAFKREASMSLEMVKLVEEKMFLTQRLASKEDSKK